MADFVEVSGLLEDSFGSLGSSGGCVVDSWVGSAVLGASVGSFVFIFEEFFGETSGSFEAKVDSLGTSVGGRVEDLVGEGSDLFWVLVNSVVSSVEGSAED